MRCLRKSFVITKFNIYSVLVVVNSVLFFSVVELMFVKP